VDRRVGLGFSSARNVDAVTTHVEAGKAFKPVAFLWSLIGSLPAARPTVDPIIVLAAFWCFVGRGETQKKQPRKATAKFSKQRTQKATRPMTGSTGGKERAYPSK